jgi:NADH-quinone oxidoreductase subunit C
MDIQALATLVATKLGSNIIASNTAYGELTIEVGIDKIVEVLTALRDDTETRFVNFIDLTAADYPEREKRFEVVYHLLSPYKNTRIRVKCAAAESDVVPSTVDVFPASNWFEREVFDLYGIMFSGHPDLRRILTDYGFQGHPLRKDFPTTGYVEVRYDDDAKRVVYEPVKLVQEFRQFDYLSPWEGAEYLLPGDEKAKSQ